MSTTEPAAPPPRTYVLIGYPDGETMCFAPFEANAPADRFQQEFRAAREAALGK